ncbi:dihydrolipoyllysine-residue succinyltransferase component of 2-oxoglutarate dehydrogenase complex, mitochondrial isoform X2 [Halyomorpha halys]|uniref:dihydrolipoyllysine-residue succinyltransferase component of 2-oxoglutarate dehydrogenase complex, mitochondrial isoform X2 n=1 Tax=Halyomorpha halys TaxID=286706 RepID=UPI0006D4F1D3|nr:dihydrolipoyllysine-residue succinyltransferase component of 2-oxoglutarate dehydrogenase complex-like isoform X2 [Halyomorpha halys]
MFLSNKMVCYGVKFHHVMGESHYTIEEEDGFQLVRVRAPPGAAESTAPGHIEWEKTVGSHVTTGDVVCRIRFKEDRSLEIKTPVTGIVAVRRKNEGDIVAHGDELFKVRLDAGSLESKKKRKVAKMSKDYYEEEAEIVGKRASQDKSGKDVKSSFIGSSSHNQEKYRKEIQGSIDPSNDKYIVSQAKQGSETGDVDTDRYRSDNLQSRVGLIPNPYSQPVVAPISHLMTTINEVNMEDTINFINKYSGYYEVKYGNKPDMRSMYVKAAAHALKLNRELNVKMVNDERTETPEIEITVAIRHLKVIVFHTVKNVDKMSYVEIGRLIFEIEKQIAAGTYKTQKGERGFTLSPEWEIGSVVGTPSHSKTCTLGLHSIIKRPIFEENRIVAYPMMYVSLTYDKNLIDDEKAVEFLKRFKESMEDPRHILVHSF